MVRKRAQLILYNAASSHQLECSRHSVQRDLHTLFIEVHERKYGNVVVSFRPQPDDLEINKNQINYEYFTCRRIHAVSDISLYQRRAAVSTRSLDKSHPNTRIKLLSKFSPFESYDLKNGAFKYSLCILYCERRLC